MGSLCVLQYTCACSNSLVAGGLAGLTEASQSNAATRLLAALAPCETCFFQQNAAQQACTCHAVQHLPPLRGSLLQPT